MPLMTPPARYFSMALEVEGRVRVQSSTLNCSPYTGCWVNLPRRVTSSPWEIPGISPTALIKVP